MKDSWATSSEEEEDAPFFPPINLLVGDPDPGWIYNAKGQGRDDKKRAIKCDSLC